MHSHVIHQTADGVVCTVAFIALKAVFDSFSSMVPRLKTSVAEMSDIACAAASEKRGLARRQLHEQIWVQDRDASTSGSYCPAFA